MVTPLAGSSCARIRTPSIAAIDFNPFAEAWNWVAASIAQLQGKKFKPYRLSTTLTPQNVNKLYPNDAKGN